MDPNERPWTWLSLSYDLTASINQMANARCNLTPLDYFLWGYVKCFVYAITTLDGTEANIRVSIAGISSHIFHTVTKNKIDHLESKDSV